MDVWSDESNKCFAKSVCYYMEDWGGTRDIRTSRSEGTSLEYDRGREMGRTQAISVVGLNRNW